MKWQWPPVMRATTMRPLQNSGMVGGCPWSMIYNIKYRPLKAFLLATETGSFTQAAELLGVTQPSFSALIRDLEQTLGLKLFERTTRSEEHTSELQSRGHLVCRLLLEKKKKTTRPHSTG